MKILTTVTGLLLLALARPARADEIPALPAAPAATQVRMQVTVMQIDCEALAKSDLNLAGLFLPSKQKREAPKAMVTDFSLTERERSLLIELLRSTKVGEIISRPQLVTLENQKAQIQVGEHIPLATIQETVNGVTTERLETKPVGLILDLTPSRVTKDSLQLAISLQESKYDAEGKNQSSKKPPLIKTRRIETHAAVPLGHTLFLAESTLFVPEKRLKEGKQLLLTVTPSVLGLGPRPAAAPAVSASGNPLTASTGTITHKMRSWRSSASEPAAVASQPSKTERWQSAYAKETRTPTSRRYRSSGPVAAAPSAVARRGTYTYAKPDASVDDELRLLRASVEVLSRDVNRLIQLLEKRVGAETKAATPRLPKPPGHELKTVPPDESAARWHSRLGIKVAEHSFPRGASPRVAYRGGLMIVELDKNGPAAKVGIREGDILVGLDEWETLTHLNLSYALSQRDKQEDDSLKFFVVRGTDTLYGHLYLPLTKKSAAAESPGDSPEAVVKRMLQGGDREAMGSLLSTKARLEASRLGLEINFTNPEAYNVTVQSAVYPHPGAKTACVSGVLKRTDPDGTTHLTRPTWHLRREEDGWKITGVAISSQEGYQPVLWDYEKMTEAMRALGNRSVYTPASVSPAPTRGGSARTANFIVSAPTLEMAKEIAQKAEQMRCELADQWLRRELATWTDPCALNVVVTDAEESGGATSFAFINKRPSRITMDIQGDLNTFDHVLAHEIMHTVLATHYGRPLPRWADEGIAATLDAEGRREGYLRLAKQCLRENDHPTFEELATRKDYPSDAESIKRQRAQSYCLVQMLLSKGDRRTLIELVQDGVLTTYWPPALERLYKFSDTTELDQAWKKWLSEQPVP